MNFETVTIKDIAKALGLSTSTVSRALRDSYEISTETKKTVLEYAEKHNYRPNPIALGLKERKTKSIGVVVCEIANNFFSQIINGIESVANERGYTVIISQSSESYEKELLNLQTLSSRAIDGLLISVSSETSDYTHLQSLHKKGLPMVLFDRIASDINTHVVTINNYQGAYEATEHLIKNGYKRIAAISNSEFLSISNERLAGYKEALEKNGITVNDKYIKHCFYGGLEFSEIEEAVDELLKMKEKPQAIIALSDKLTVGTLKLLKNRNYKIPANIALVGFSNTEIGDMIDPPLTVVRQPAMEMGKVAMEMLLQLIESKRPVTEFENRVLQPQFIIRDSGKK